MRRRWLLANVATLALGGCSLIVSTDGLSTRDAGTEPGPDASSDVRDAELLDGSRDASLDERDAPAPPFCAALSPAPTFCADFDSGALVPAFSVSGATLDAARFLSPSRSLLGVVDAGATNRFSSVRRDFLVAPASAEISFAARIQEYDDSNDIEIVNLLMTKPGGSCNLVASIRQKVWTLDEYCETNGTGEVTKIHASTKAGARGRWTSVTYSASFGSARTYSLSIDGEQIFDAQPLAAGFVAGPASVSAGINYVQPGAGRAEVNVDNLVVRLR